MELILLSFQLSSVLLRNIQNKLKLFKLILFLTIVLIPGSHLLLSFFFFAVSRMFLYTFQFRQNTINRAHAEMFDWLKPNYRFCWPSFQQVQQYLNPAPPSTDKPSHVAGVHWISPDAGCHDIQCISLHFRCHWRGSRVLLFSGDLQRRRQVSTSRIQRTDANFSAH